MDEKLRDTILTILESTFDFAWKMHSEENVHKFNQLYIFLCTLDTPVGKRMKKYICSDIEHKTYMIGELYQETVHAHDITPYKDLAMFPLIISEYDEEFKRRVLPNAMTIENIVRDIVPVENVMVKVGTVGPGIYILTNRHYALNSLYEYLDTFDFGHVLYKYIVHVTI